MCGGSTNRGQRKTKINGVHGACQEPVLHGLYQTCAAGRRAGASDKQKPIESVTVTCHVHACKCKTQASLTRLACKIEHVGAKLIHSFLAACPPHPNYNVEATGEMIFPTHLSTYPQHCIWGCGGPCKKLWMSFAPTCSTGMQKKCT